LKEHLSIAKIFLHYKLMSIRHSFLNHCHHIALFRLLIRFRKQLHMLMELQSKKIHFLICTEMSIHRLIKHFHRHILQYKLLFDQLRCRHISSNRPSKHHRMNFTREHIDYCIRLHRYNSHHRSLLKIP